MCLGLFCLRLCARLSVHRTGRETTGEFKRLWFRDQLTLTAQDLQTDFWREDARVVANSFGAYLLLHTQAQMESVPGRVLLLSPIVGEFEDAESSRNFSPPRADVLGKLASAGKLPIPRECEAHVGADDWQSMPENVSSSGELLGIAVHVAPGNGHMLDKADVRGVLDRWLAVGCGQNE